VSTPLADASFINAVADVAKVFLGGILAAIVTLWVAGRRQDQDRHRAARHVAIRLIDIFERYALDAGDAIQRNLNGYRDNPHDYSGIAYLPELSPLPEDDAGWRGLEPSFAIQAQTFGGLIRVARSFISAVGEHGDADDVEEEVNRQAVTLGKAAWELGTCLRAAYLLPSATPAYDLVAIFNSEESRLTKIAREKAEATAEFWAMQMATENDGPHQIPGQ
jgi:hypothetical protein